MKRREMLFFKKCYGKTGLILAKSLYAMGGLFRRLRLLRFKYSKDGTHFRKDFDKIVTLIQEKRPFAFARYADGEYSLLNGIPIGKQTQAYQQDKWSFSGNSPIFKKALIESTLHTEPNYF